ncbi:MAG TPA: hypothetical protein VFR84_05100 [Candidatus Angelobacter sp.]|nr:hypothetical protein [Candidatus Angelobacter sp.]
MRSLKTAALVALVATLLYAEKHFNPPPAGNANSYALHETHADEKVSVALDPVDTPEKAKIFGVNYRGYGFYPVRLIITNDSDNTLMLQNLKIELITARREKLQPATDADIYRRLVKPNKASHPGPKLPFPTGKKEPLSKEVREEYESAQFLTVPVTPHATHSGYLFFDVMDTPIEAGAHLQVSGIKAGAQELFYFDIPMDRSPSDMPLQK